MAPLGVVRLSVLKSASPDLLSAGIINEGVTIDADGWMRWDKGECVTLVGYIDHRGLDVALVCRLASSVSS